MSQVDLASSLPALPNVRLLRSLLIVPPRSEEFIIKASRTSADVLMLDLDDCVPYTNEHKVAARQVVAQALRSGKLGDKVVTVRTNSIDTPWWRDEISELGPLRPSGLCPAKLNTAQDVVRIETAMRESELPNEVELWAMIESPGAVLFAEQIAACERVTTLFFGLGDFTVATRGQFTNSLDRLRYPLGKVVCAARYHDCECIGPMLLNDDIARIDLMYEQARMLREMGYTGAGCIHPAYLSVINEVFGPSTAELRDAVALVRQYKDAIARGVAAVLVDGFAIERVHVSLAMRTVATARRLGMSEAFEE